MCLLWLIRLQKNLWSGTEPLITQQLNVNVEEQKYGKTNTRENFDNILYFTTTV